MDASHIALSIAGLVIGYLSQPSAPAERPCTCHCNCSTVGKGDSGGIFYLIPVLSVIAGVVICIGFGVYLAVQFFGHRLQSVTVQTSGSSLKGKAGKRVLGVRSGLQILDA